MEQLSLTVFFLALGVSLVLCLIAAFIAKSKGQSFLLWFLYAGLVAPIALIHALLLKPTQAADDRAAIKAGMIQCPHCAEFIRPDAKICRYCHSEVKPVSVSRLNGGSDDGADFGLVVKSVLPGSPAERCGICVGDIVQSIDGELLTNLDELVTATDKLSADAEVDVCVLRNGEPVYLAFKGATLDIKVSEV